MFESGRHFHQNKPSMQYSCATHVTKSQQHSQDSRQKESKCHRGTICISIFSTINWTINEKQLFKYKYYFYYNHLIILYQNDNIFSDIA